MPLQDHIHLSNTLGGSPEFSPDRTWIITDREEILEAELTIRRMLNGKQRLHSRTLSGNPVVYTNYRYTLKIADDLTYTRWQKRDTLKGWLGKSVYVCDVVHANTGSSHASDTKAMYLTAVGAFKAIDPGLQYFLVEIELTDNFTVA